MPPRISGTYIPNPQLPDAPDEIDPEHRFIAITRRGGHYRAQLTSVDGDCVTVNLTHTDVADFRHLIATGRIQKISKWLLTPDGL